MKALGYSLWHRALIQTMHILTLFMGVISVPWMALILCEQEAQRPLQHSNGKFFFRKVPMKFGTERTQHSIVYSIHQAQINPPS